MREIIRNRKKIIKQWSKNGPRGSKVKNFLSRVRGVLFPWTPYVLGRGEGMSAGENMNLSAQVRKNDDKEGNSLLK